MQITVIVKEILLLGFLFVAAWMDHKRKELPMEFVIAMSLTGIIFQIIATLIPNVGRAVLIAFHRFGTIEQIDIVAFSLGKDVGHKAERKQQHYNPQHFSTVIFHCFSPVLSILQNIIYLANI